MACLEDDELVQMVRDFIESESSSPTESTSLKSHALTHRTKCYISLYNPLLNIDRKEREDQRKQAKGCFGEVMERG